MPALGPDGDRLNIYKLCSSVPDAKIEELLNDSLTERYDAICIPLSETKSKAYVRALDRDNVSMSCSDEVIVSAQGGCGGSVGQQLVFPFTPTVPSDLSLSSTMWAAHVIGVCSSIADQTVNNPSNPASALCGSSNDREYCEDQADRINGDERDVYHALVEIVRREVDWGLHLGLHSIVLPTPKVQVHPTGELELDPVYSSLV